MLNKPKRGVPLNPDLKRVLEKANWKNKTEERAGPYSCRKSCLQYLKLIIFLSISTRHSKVVRRRL